MRFSRTVRRLKIRRPSGTWPMPRPTTSWGGVPVSTRSSRWIVPWRGASSPGDRLERRGLAGAVVAEQRDDLAAAHLQRDALEGADLPVVDVEAVKAQHWHSGEAPRRPRYASMTRASLWTWRGRPSAIFSPWSSTVTRSETSITTRMLCSISRIARSRSPTSRRSRTIRCARLALGHAGGRLVEQQQRGLGGQGAGQLQPALIAVRQIARDLVGLGGEAHAVQQRVAALPEPTLHLVEARPVAERVPDAERHAGVHADQHVLDGRHVGEEPDVLERAAHAERGDLIRAQTDQRVAAEGDRPALGRVEAGEHVEEGRLAGAVGPDDRGDAAVEGVVHAVDGDEAAEALGDVARLEQRAHDLLELALAPAGREDALRAEDHHQHEDDAEHHALVLGGLELGRQVGQAVAEAPSRRRS